MSLEIVDDFQADRNNQNIKKTVYTTSLVRTNIADEYTYVDNWLPIKIQSKSNQISGSFISDNYSDSLISNKVYAILIHNSIIESTIVDTYKVSDFTHNIQVDPIAGQGATDAFFLDSFSALNYDLFYGYITPNYELLKLVPINVVDDMGTSPTEWILITEDGFIISLEPFDDEFGITVV